MTQQNIFEQRCEDGAYQLDIIPCGQTMRDGDEDVDMTASPRNPLLQSATLSATQTAHTSNPLPISK